MHFTSSFLVKALKLIDWTHWAVYVLHLPSSNWITQIKKKLYLYYIEISFFEISFFLQKVWFLIITIDTMRPLNLFGIKHKNKSSSYFQISTIKFRWKKWFLNHYNQFPYDRHWLAFFIFLFDKTIIEIYEIYIFTIQNGENGIFMIW